MTNPSSEMSDALFEPRGSAPALVLPTRPFYWSVRRELWENRSVIVAPLIVAGVAMFGFLVGSLSLRRHMTAAMAAVPPQRPVVVLPYMFAAGILILTAFVVGVFYCLDALHSERRDRSILFWKSLPVSDRTAVLAKVAIPLVVLPLFTFVLIVAVQLMMVLVSSAVLAGHGPLLATYWAWLPFFRIFVALLYGLITIALWHAPIYAWLLLVSAWARRAAFIWAVLPLAAINLFERIAYHTSNFCSLLQYRVFGWFMQGFTGIQHSTYRGDPLASIAPGQFLSTPELWVGLALAAVFLALAVRLRRNRGPI